MGQDRMTDLLTAAQVAALSGCHRVTVAQACQHGRLPATKLGKTWLIERQDAEAAIAAGVIKPRPRKSKAPSR